VSSRRALACLLLALCFAVAAALAGMSATVSAAGDDVIALSLASAAIETLIAALAVAAALCASGDPRERLGLPRTRFGAAPTALLIVGTLGLSHALDAVLTLSGLYEESALADFARSLHGARGLPLLAAAIGIGLLPGIAEELLCRGLLQRSLLPRLGAPAAIGLSALAFGALHVEPLHASFAFVLGAYLGLAGHWSGGVRVPIACHAANNLFAVVVSARFGPTPWVSPLDVAAGLALAAAALALTARLRPRSGLQPAPGSVDG
jgi:membrane protease YdiL (CAAX protease family)